MLRLARAVVMVEMTPTLAQGSLLQMMIERAIRGLCSHSPRSSGKYRPVQIALVPDY